MPDDVNGRAGLSRRRFLTATGTAALAASAGCLGGEESQTASGGAWQSVELQRVRGGETFTIQGLSGPVLVQSFAVWCPKCERQSKQFAQLSGITRVSLNTDPNEDAAKVRDHAESKGFGWRFAVAPTEMTNSLIEQFGNTVTNAPSTPIIAVCDDGTAMFNAGEIRDASALESMVSDC